MPTVIPTLLPSPPPSPSPPSPPLSPPPPPSFPLQQDLQLIVGTKDFSTGIYLVPSFFGRDTVLSKATRSSGANSYVNSEVTGWTTMGGSVDCGNQNLEAQASTVWQEFNKGGYMRE